MNAEQQIAYQETPETIQDKFARAAGAIVAAGLVILPALNTSAIISLIPNLLIAASACGLATGIGVYTGLSSGLKLDETFLQSMKTNVTQKLPLSIIFGVIMFGALGSAMDSYKAQQQALQKAKPISPEEFEPAFKSPCRNLGSSGEKHLVFVNKEPRALTCP